MNDEIRKATVVIIRKNWQYLAGCIEYSKEIRWTPYRYDAWRTRDIEEARAVAKATGGVMELFNPIIGQSETLGC